MALSDVTFFNKEGITCPICGAEFKKEELRQGGGRLIAGTLTNELRRLYEPSKKYGDIYPQIYQVYVCPKCFYASFPADFDAMKEREKEAIRLGAKERIDEAVALIGKFHFDNKRSLSEGLASYVLALFCYEKREKDSTPTFKKALSCLRAAWICTDLHKKYPNDNWDYLSLIFYRKSQFFYNEVVNNEQTGKEAMTRVAHAGPDTDKNYGYEGVLYLAGILEYSYGPKDNPKARVQTLGNAKRALSKIVGMGKASKDKPGVLLEKARDLFDEIGSQLKALNAE